ncbi:Uncharacterised protein [uncultured archaeon]|nr:Uncharacterised protein [uncultured archaeon]
MGFRSVAMALAFIGCLCATILAEEPENQIADPQFSGVDASGSENSDLSFRNENLFLIRADTGMSPNATATGVRTPVAAIQGMRIASAAGSWSFTLTDTATRYLSLDLYQTVDAVFGSGKLTDKGTTVQATAGGTVLGDRLSLYVTPIGTQNLYRLSLTIKPGSMDGDYIFTAPGTTQPGVAFGSLVAPGGIAGQSQ